MVPDHVNILKILILNVMITVKGPLKFGREPLAPAIKLPTYINFKVAFWPLIPMICLGMLGQKVGQEYSFPGWNNKIGSRGGAWALGL